MLHYKILITGRIISALTHPFVGVNNYINEIITYLFWSTVLHNLNTDFHNLQYVVRYH